MSMKNTRDSYGTVTKIFHWGVAITIYGMLTLGYFLESIKPQWLQDQAYFYHKSFGLTILFAVILRFVWRMINPRPEAPKTMATWQLIASRFVHFALYASLLIMPISALIMETASGYSPSFFGLFSVRMPFIHTSKALADRAHSIHETMAIVLICLIVVHVLAALKHHFVDKDNVLQRMLPSSNKPASTSNTHQEASQTP